VIYWIRERGGFISIVGEAGTGKTILIHSLMNSLDEKVKTILIFHTTVSFNDLLRVILRELDLWDVEKSEKSLWNQLVQYSTQIAAKNEILVIIIDEAQKLTEEVMEKLKMFSNLESKAIKIVLVGQPELEDKLNLKSLTQLKQMIRVRCQIKALSEEESKEYIDHRLRYVGSSSLEMFTPESVSMICHYAKGIPRIINTLCDIAFLTGYRLFKKKIDESIIREAIKDMEGPRLQKPPLVRPYS
jgi:general secretion pathway protein A